MYKQTATNTERLLLRTISAAIISEMDVDPPKLANAEFHYQIYSAIKTIYAALNAGESM